MVVLSVGDSRYLQLFEENLSTGSLIKRFVGITTRLASLERIVGSLG